MIAVLLAGSDGRWRFAVGDPNFVGWVTVAAYAVAALLAVRALSSARLGARELRASDRREAGNQRTLARLWLFIAASMIALGINKQLDLQSLFLQTVRDRARRDGWYEDRRQLQLLFVVAIALAGAVGTLVLAYALRQVLHRILGAVVGFGLLVSFVVVRAASLHYVDAVLALGGIRVNWIIELGGLGLMCVSLYRAPEFQRVDPAPPSRAHHGDSSSPAPVDVGSDNRR